MRKLMTLAAAIPLPDDYGFVEMKRIIARNTKTSIAITACGILLLLSAYYSVFGSNNEITFERGTVPTIEITTIKPPNDGTKIDPIVNTVPVIPDIGTSEVCGNPNPVNAEAGRDLPEFADFSIMNESMTTTGTIKPSDIPEFTINDNPGTYSIPSETKTAASEENDDPGTYTYYDKDVVFDPAELAANIDYPSVAKNTGLTGKVMVTVFIDKTGMPKKARVTESSNKIFNEAAVKAVTKTIFIPASADGKPVGIWLSIPIKFMLD